MLKQATRHEGVWGVEVELHNFFTSIVSGQPHTSAALPPEEEPPVCIQWEAGWPPISGLTSLSLPGVERMSFGRSARNLVTAQSLRRLLQPAVLSYDFINFFCRLLFCVRSAAATTLCGHLTFLTLISLFKSDPTHGNSLLT
jgi:hypothetical protein